MESWRVQVSLNAVISQGALRVLDEVQELSSLFRKAGHSLYLVGGAVRDILIQPSIQDGEMDLDMTTNATPGDIERIVSPVASGMWTVGREFGTIGLIFHGRRVEVTTHRKESYVSESRKPVVSFSTSVEEDLSRRDFTVNSMAISLTEDKPELLDPYNGLSDLMARKLRTPIGARISFSEDPLRMLRAARFIARFHLEPDQDMLLAIEEMKPRLAVVSPERIRDELDKLLTTEDPSEGLWFLVNNGLFDLFIPEVPALALEQDPIHHHKDVLAHTVEVVRRASPDRILRLAALFHDVGKPRTRQVGQDGVSFHFHDVVGARMTRKRMAQLRYSQLDIDEVAQLVELHLRFHTYGSGWSDSAVRRYVRDAGPQLKRLNELTLCDATTRNEYKVRVFRERMTELESRIEDLRTKEELDAIRPDLDGVEVMKLLGIGPSRVVGKALGFLMELRMEEGPLGKEEAGRRLLDWWTDNS